IEILLPLLTQTKARRLVAEAGLGHNWHLRAAAPSSRHVTAALPLLVQTHWFLSAPRDVLATFAW
ncbi:hypothetical protein, partial [Bradyrhizobium japonicum]|uniref:hypothetical protein n=1 Tax=Bradyrhizobium japonicum TaxID=375 RepID=UPI001E3E9459